MANLKFQNIKNYYVAVRKKLAKFFINKEGILVMTLLVRNEDDIIRENIEYHIKHGVDFIIATDNGSIDKTREILEEYEKKGCLFLIDEPLQDNSQAGWVNKMGEIALNKYKADYIIHCDADEFWFAKSGNLKKEISQSKKDVLIVNVKNVLLNNKNGEECFPSDALYLVINPLTTENLQEDSKNENLYIFNYPSKLFSKTSKGYQYVTKGNHALAYKNANIKKGNSEDVIIYHFPVRNKERFINKVINSGSATESNKDLHPSLSWHIRRWYEAYKNGTINIEYEKLLMSKDRAIDLIDDGVLEEFDFIKFKEKQ